MAFAVAPQTFKIEPHPVTFGSLPFDVGEKLSHLMNIWHMWYEPQRQGHDACDHLHLEWMELNYHASNEVQIGCITPR